MYYIILYNIILYHTILYSTMLYYIIPYSTLLHYKLLPQGLVNSLAQLQRPGRRFQKATASWSSGAARPASAWKASGPVMLGEYGCSFKLKASFTGRPCKKSPTIWGLHCSHICFSWVPQLPPSVLPPQGSSLIKPI